MTRNHKKLNLSNLSTWLKFVLVAIIFPIIAVGYSLNHIEKLQGDTRLQKFQSEAADSLDKLSQVVNSDEFICRNITEIYENAKNTQTLRERVEAFSNKFDLGCQILIWKNSGEIEWSNFDYQKVDADWPQAYRSLRELSVKEKESLVDQENVNLRKVFGPHFFSRYYQHCYWDLNPRMIRGDSAEKVLPCWVRVGKKYGLLVYITSEKISSFNVFIKSVLEQVTPENCSIGAFVEGELITNSNLFGFLSPQELKKLHQSYDSLHHTSGCYLYKSFYKDKISGFVLIPEQYINGLHLTWYVEYLLGTFACLLIIVLFLSFRVMILDHQITVNIRKQLVILFLLSNAFPLMILGVLGFDYLRQYENFLKIEAFSRGMTYLQNIDEMFVSELSHQLRKMNDAFKWLPEELKKSPPNRQMVERFIKTQYPPPFRLMLIGSHTAEVGSELGIMKDGQFISIIDKDWAKFESMRNLVEALDKMGKYYLSRLNNESISEKAMLQIELIAESLGQIKPIEMIQEFFAATGMFWQWGMGKQYYPAHIRVLNLFNSEKYDYVFLYLYKPDLLQYNYFKRVYDAINRNDIGLRIVAVDDSLNSSIPPTALEDKNLRDYATRLRNKSGSEVEFCEWQNEQHMLMGLKCSYLDKLRLIGIYPMMEIARKANEKYNLFMASGLLSLLISLSFGLIVSRSFLYPISELQKGVLALKYRSFDYRLPELGHDEFGRLAGIFNSTLVDLEELQVASVVQEKLLPDIKKDFKVGCLNYSGLSVSFFRLGGDFIDNFSLDNERDILAIGDVAGQGVGASLVMAFVKSCILQLKNSANDPAAVVKKINELICDTNTRKHRKFMTFQFLLLDGKTGEINIANAGHCFPILINSQSKEMKIIDMPSSPLGASRKNKIAQSVIRLGENESLVLYSGGLYRNPGLTFEDLGEVLQTNSGKVPTEYCQAVMDSIFTRVPQKDCTDDLSLILIQKIS